MVHRGQDRRGSLPPQAPLKWFSLKKKKDLLIFSITRSWWSSTGHEWVPNISLVTDTDWDMIGHLTVGIGATETWAGINTVEVPALLASWAVRVDDTFWSAGNIRVSEVVRDAATGTSRASLGTDSIASTGRRIAGIN